MVLAALVLSQLTAKRAGMWDLTVRYPRFSAGGPVARMANAEARRRERRAFDTFLADAKKEMPGLKKDGVTGSYELQVVPHRITDRPGLASGYVDTYSYMAGAHGMTSYDAINVGRVGGKVCELRLADLFRPGQDAVGQCSRAIVAVLRAGKEDAMPSNVANGEWKGLDKDQAKHFVVGPKGVLFLFGHYELASYAEGVYVVLVPYAKLPGLDRKGVLAAVIR